MPRTDKPAPRTRIVVQTDGTVYSIGPKGGTRWVASLSARDLQTLSRDAKRAASTISGRRISRCPVLGWNARQCDGIAGHGGTHGTLNADMTS